MSAYLVPKETVVRLGRAAVNYVKAPHERAAQLAGVIWQENARSVAFLYKEAEMDVEPVTVEDIKTAPPFSAAMLLEDIRNVIFQICEHPDWEQSVAFQIIEALNEAATVEAKMEAAAAAAEREMWAKVAEADRKRAVEKGRVFAAAHKPAKATHVIVAQLMQDESDSQSDYFAHSTKKTVVLAWSTHGRDLFSEMRKAAALLPETAHLGPGKDEWSARVVIDTDFKSNGSYYHKGQTSPWHREYDDQRAVFLTEAEAVTHVAGQGPLHKMLVDGGTEVNFQWEIRKSSVEHREKYSMGSGYYLGTTRHSGWKVSKRDLERGDANYAALGRGDHTLNVTVPKARKSQPAPGAVAAPTEEWAVY